MFRPLPFLLVLTPLACAHDLERPAPSVAKASRSTLSGHLHLDWESHYFTEGRDALDGDSLLVASAEFTWHRLLAGFWYGNSPDRNYDELQLTAGLTESMGDFEFYLAYTHFRFPFDNSHDDEIGVGVLWTGLPAGLELALDAYYSFDAEGYFAELALSRVLAEGNALTIACDAIFGVNQGYVADGHDGANHLAFKLGAEYALTDNLSLISHLTYSWALDREATAPGDELLIDFFHGGLGLQWAF